MALCLNSDKHVILLHGQPCKLLDSFWNVSRRSTRKASRGNVLQSSITTTLWFWTYFPGKEIWFAHLLIEYRHPPDRNIDCYACISHSCPALPTGPLNFLTGLCLLTLHSDLGQWIGACIMWLCPHLSSILTSLDKTDFAQIPFLSTHADSESIPE